MFLQPYYTPQHQDTPFALGLGGASLLLWEIFTQRFSWGLHRWLPHPTAYDMRLAKRVWEASVHAVAE